MVESLDFQQNYYSKTAQDIYKCGHNSFRLIKCLAYYDRYCYEKKVIMI